ncbi:hypothetical protein F4604DRAFT_1921112 [Suillus subluteus]|nr:hypothetical protein F4604DRAFT_1921112 [Suillus subluteus]
MATFIFNTLPAWIAHLVSALGAQLAIDQRIMFASDRPTSGGSVTINAGDGCDQPLKKIFIPDLLARWPFPRRLNQHYSKVSAEASAWLESLKVFSPKAQKAFDSGKFCLLSCLSYPIACEEHLRSACDFMNLAFIIDEFSDVSDEGEVRQQKGAIMDALRHPHKPRPTGEWVGGEVTRQFWERTIRNTSGQSQKWFIAAFDEYLLEGVAQQAVD